jgi:hypothetical protein
MSNPYQRIQISLLTQHGKEKVIAPEFKKGLGAEILLIDHFNTDELGTFTRDIPRYGSQLDAARRKAHIGMEIGNTKYGIASEGVFSQDPYSGIMPINHEIIVFIDSIEKIEIIGEARSAAMNHHASIKTWNELLQFAKLNQFPRHHLVLRPDHQDHPAFAKGIKNLTQLEESFHEAMKLSKKKRIFIEHDLRAFANPTRMKNIKEATKNLILKMKSLCPKCHAPGFWQSRNEIGLPCAICEMPSNQIKAKIYTCLKCDYEKKEYVKDKKADPAKCNLCNP